MSEVGKVWLVYTMGQENPLWICPTESDAQMYAEDERRDRTSFVFVEEMNLSTYDN